MVCVPVLSLLYLFDETFLSCYQSDQESGGVVDRCEDVTDWEVIDCLEQKMFLRLLPLMSVFSLTGLMRRWTNIWLMGFTNSFLVLIHDPVAGNTS